MKHRKTKSLEHKGFPSAEREREGLRDLQGPLILVVRVMRVHPPRWTGAHCEKQPAGSRSRMNN